MLILVLTYNVVFFFFLTLGGSRRNILPSLFMLYVSVKQSNEGYDSDSKGNPQLFK